MADFHPRLIDKAKERIGRVMGWQHLVKYATQSPEWMDEVLTAMARAALSAVADDLRAEGAAEALREAAPVQRGTKWLLARADQIEHDARCPHPKCAGGSLCCCADAIEAGQS